jgi:hypothetical protein
MVVTSKISGFHCGENGDGESGSSVSIVSDYRLVDRAIEVRSPAKAEGIFLWPLCSDQLWGPSSHLYNFVPAGPSRGAKSRLRRDTDHSPPHLVARSRMSRSYSSSPPPSGTALALE